MAHLSSACESQDRWAILLLSERLPVMRRSVELAISDYDETGSGLVTSIGTASVGAVIGAAFANAPAGKP